MRIIGRQKRNPRILMTLLLVAVFARALVAPGYMLDASRGFSHGVPITLCSGLKGIDAIPGFAPIHNGHGAHHAGHHHDSSPPHFTAACGMWSAGTSFISVAFNDMAFAGPPRDLYLVDRERRKAVDSVARTRFARAPPRLS